MNSLGIDDETIFHVARGIDDLDRRREYILSACKEEPALVAHLEALLAACKVHDRLLDRPAIAGSPDIEERVGAIIGPYKLVEQIGEGGMGAVFMAEQTHPVRRKVAVKVIKAGMDTRQVIARFEAERQALAMMDHVNIARVFDAGATETGRPYFVMELVHGVPITNYCDDNHLTPRERLELFVPVCQAIQHAHQKGMIHRDIKPSNVMVTLYDGKPVPKIIDFGVAKAIEQKLTDGTLLTQYGTLVGTFEYMSPEQAEMSALGVDTRSDVYSLGVLLYELLTGSTPLTRQRLKEAAYDEVLRIIREEDPPKPSTRLSDSCEALASISAQRHMEPTQLTKLVRGELDWIVMKCLDKERNRRYQTANGLASDVQRFLADESVEASPPSASYQLRKFVRRNKSRVLAAAGFATLVVLGIAALIVGIFAINAERQRTAEALAQVTSEQAKTQLALAAETTARVAERHARDQAMAALRAMTDDIVENQMARATHLTEENKEFLRKIIKHLEGFAALTSVDAESRAIRAEGYMRVGVMQHRLGEAKEAETAFADALAILKPLAADFPARPEFRQALASSQNNLGNLFRDTGRLQKSEEAYADALTIQRALVADFPTRVEFRQTLATHQMNLGNLLRDTGRSKNAETAYADALTIQSALVVDYPTRVEFRQILATNQMNLGNLLRDTGRLQEAQTAYADALTILKALAADFPTRFEFRQTLATSHNNLGSLFRDTGRYAEAEAAFADALAIRKKLAAEFPAHPEFRQGLALSLHGLSGLRRATGRLQEAETALADALVIQKQLVLDFPARAEFREDLAVSHHNLGDVRWATGRLREAESDYADALAIQKPLAADFPTRPEFRRALAMSHNRLGALLHAMGRRQEAEAACADALAIQKILATDFSSRPEFRQELAMSYNNRANVLSDAGRHRESEMAFADALAIQKPLAADFPNRPQFRHDLALTHHNSGVLFQNTGRIEHAEKAYAEALAIRKQLAADFPDLQELRNQAAGTGVNLAILCNLRRDFKSAKAYLDEAQPHHQAALKANPRNTMYWQWFGNNLNALVHANAGLQDQVAALQAAQRLRDLGFEPQADAYDAACGLALCIPVVEADKHLDSAALQTAVKFYGDQAMAMLRDAVAKGYKDIAHMKKDKDLDALRDREDFRKLLAEMEAKQNE